MMMRTAAADQVFETYETKWRGIEAMLPNLQLLDLTRTADRRRGGITCWLAGGPGWVVVAA